MGLAVLAGAFGHGRAWPWRRKSFRESHRFARLQQSGAGAESDIATLSKLSMEIAISE